MQNSWEPLIFPEVFAIPWRAISKKLGLMAAQLAKKFIFLNVACTWISVFRKTLLSVSALPTLFLCDILTLFSCRCLYSPSNHIHSDLSTNCFYIQVQLDSFLSPNIYEIKYIKTFLQELSNKFWRFVDRASFCWPCISVYLSQYLTKLMHKICFTISSISCLYMFRAHVLETCRGMK